VVLFLIRRKKERPMAVQHMVWLKFKPGVSPERIEEHMQALRGMQGKVPQVQYVAAGKSLVDRAGDYTHGVVVTMNSPEDLPAYEEHPEHQKVAKPLKEDAQVMAIDIDDGSG
jgi:hypothetical protein